MTFLYKYKLANSAEKMYALHFLVLDKLTLYDHPSLHTHYIWVH